MTHRQDGGVWDHPHKDPRTLQEAQVDALMLPIVQRINRSGWLWTTEACQGHADRRLQPMLGLTTNDVGRLWKALQAADSYSLTECEDPSGTALTVRHFSKPRFPALGSIQVRITCESLDFFERLAEAV